MNSAEYIRQYRTTLKALEASHGRDRAMELIVGGLYEQIGILEYSLLNAVGIRGVSTIVDIGCGTGRLGYALRDRFSGRYIGTDILQELLDYASEKCGRPDWSFHCTDEPCIPVGDGEADIVAYFSVFTHLFDEDIYRYLEESKRACKCGGKIIFSYLDIELDSHWPLFMQSVNTKGDAKVFNRFLTKGTIKRLCRELGLNIARFYDGTEQWIPLVESIRYDEYRTDTGVVGFGQSVCVVEK